MTCCTQYCAAGSQFNHKVAQRELRRYRRRGAGATTRLMLAELRRWPLEGRQLLDVGGGIGVISAELAGTGVASATMVEASPSFLEVARREVGTRYVERPIQFILGDFAVIADTLPDADVVTLDRVVCCYPDAEALLRAAATRTRQTLAFTYPRDRWYVRTMFALANFWLRLTGKEFRAFVHSPQRMGVVLEEAGLVRVARRGTLVWTLELHRRGDILCDSKSR
jgi:2-polyprenyl-3-methyl-5-hydroxy-6-metoxy-1,4-benzoquinol methylase